MKKRARPHSSQDSHDKQPNSSHCFVCGLDNPRGLAMSFYSAGPGEVEARYTVPEAYQGYPGTVHGGILAAMLDEVVGRVVMTEDPNRFFVTAKLELRFRAPVPVGEELHLFGHLQKESGHSMLATGEILLPDGNIGVEARAVLVDRPEIEPDAQLLSQLGWKVYPD
jgi:acyl-coenzyme A thioesterase PaaI-like protein